MSELKLTQIFVLLLCLGLPASSCGQTTPKPIIPHCGMSRSQIDEIVRGKYEHIDTFVHKLRGGGSYSDYFYSGYRLAGIRGTLELSYNPKLPAVQWFCGDSSNNSATALLIKYHPNSFAAMDIQRYPREVVMNDFLKIGEALDPELGEHSVNGPNHFRYHHTGTIDLALDSGAIEYLEFPW